MRDVAALAGVSLKTVSRVVNLEPHTRPEVVRRVRAAIAELDWVPNASARSLRTGRTGLVGIGVTELRRPYLATLVEELVTEADRRGFQSAVEPTHGDPARTDALLESVGRVFDAVVHLGPLPTGAEPQGLRGDRPVVVVQGGRPVEGVDRVDEDVLEAVVLLARHLAVMGRTRPVLLGPDRARRDDDAPGRPSAALRAGLTMSRIDLAGVGCVDLPDGVWDRRVGAHAAEEALARFPDADALLCVNDEVALGALAALSAADVDVPGRVAVIGYDNLDDGRFSTPSLTTIDPGPRRLARVALEMVADRLTGMGTTDPRAVTTRVDLVRRESTLGEEVR